MRITLVHPAGFNFVPGQPDLSLLANRIAPIGILSLAAWLDRHGHPTAVYDALGPFAPRSLEQQADKLQQQQELAQQQQAEAEQLQSELTAELTTVGTSVERIDGIGFVTGRTR